MKHDNLNRIRGILSAREGAQIPKFTPGGALYYKDLGNGKKVYSKTQESEEWYTDEQCTDPYTLIDDTFRNAPVQEIRPAENTSVQNSNDAFRNTLNAVSNHVLSQLQSKPDQTVTTVILGQSSDVGNPTAAVEAAANERGAVEKERNSNRVAKQARKEDLLAQGISWQRANLNENGLTKNQQNRIDRIASNNEARADRVEQRLVDRNTVTVDERNQTLGQIGQGLSQGIQVIGDAFGAKQAATDSELTKGLDMGFDATADIASQFGPVGQAIGGAMKIAGAAGDIIQEITGGNDQMTAADKVLSSSWLSWTPISAINDLFGKESDAFATDVEALETVGSSYGGTANDISETAAKAGKKYGLFSSGARKRANEAAQQVAAKQGLMSNIADTARDQRLAVQSMGEQAGLAYSMMIDGGYNQKYTYAAKHGGLLEWNPVIELEWQPQVELNWELPTFKAGGSVEFVEELEWIPEFKDGGKTEESDIPETEETNQKNVIPEGALHKNKHHMEHAEGLTKKGIPVVDEDGEQQAEIEHSEIIFTLEVTKKLEEYYEIFYSEDSTNKEKEQAALDAGKLLVYQILENTEDRTGLIESCKKGGSLTLKKSTDDLIEEVIEWMPTVVIVETEEEPKKESKKEKSEVSKKDTKDEIKEMIREVLIELLVK